MPTLQRVNPGRVTLLKDGEIKKAPVVYWMQRDQRVNDNWALLYAQELAVKNSVPLLAAFSLAPEFNNASPLHYSFMLEGLKKVERDLSEYKIPFVLLSGEAGKTIPQFVKDVSAGVLVADFNPLRNVMKWKSEIKGKIKIPFYEVDAHNIVPCRIASGKQEYGAYTIRPKINRLLDTYLEEFPSLAVMKKNGEEYKNDWRGVKQSFAPARFAVPGEDEALKVLQSFIDNKFINYSVKRNDPVLDATSNLSPYFHFGQIAPQRVALTVQRLTDYPQAQASFLEEMIIRRELADNYCFYNPEYDSFEGFHPWAKETLNLHRIDKREYICSLKEFEQAETHDKLWNAAQLEMVKTGRMHGYMRMYWGKKILEWSKTPDEAMKTAVYLNDRYELDGRDPNGYTGIAWSIGGVHDRAWGERNIFGKIRYMNLNGCRRKFDVDLYIEKISLLNENI